MDFSEYKAQAEAPVPALKMAAVRRAAPFAMGGVRGRVSNASARGEERPSAASIV